VGRRTRRAEDGIALRDIRAGFEPLRACATIVASPFRSSLGHKRNKTVAYAPYPHILKSN